MSRKLSFPWVMTAIFFLMFVAAYIFVTVYAVRPYYLAGLLFAVPFFCFGLIALIAGKRNKRVKWANIMTAVLIPVFLAAACLLFSLISMHAATTEVTDLRYYNRALARSSYREWAREGGVDFFPKELPRDAGNIRFYYTPSFMMGGDTLALGFSVSGELLEKYDGFLSPAAEWKGKYGNVDMSYRWALSWLFSEPDTMPLSADDTVYILHKQPYLENNWNHGKIAFAIINPERGTIAFCYKRW